MTFFESWIVEDPKNDKSNIYKLGAKGGEWCVMMKIYNDEEWQQVKDGSYKGFSIEGGYQGFEQLQRAYFLQEYACVLEQRQNLELRLLLLH